MFTDAQYYLGVILYYGDGVKPDAGAAARQFRLAAEQGHVNAMINLGVIYSGGAPGLEDYAAASNWLARAVAYGDANAQWMLGKLHYDGRLRAKPDLFEAFKVRVCAIHGLEGFAANCFSFRSCSVSLRSRATHTASSTQVC